MSEIKVDNKRMISQDIAKGLCMLMVVFAHSCTVPVGLGKYLFSIAGYSMPFFFIISGYNYKKKDVSNLSRVGRKVKQLLLPLFIYSTVLFAVFGIKELLLGTSFYDVISSYLGSLLTQEYIVSSSYTGAVVIPSWFIWYLFFGYVLFYLLCDFALEKKIRTIVVLILLIALEMVLYSLNIHLPLGISDAPLCCALILLGAFFRQNEIFSKKFSILFCLFFIAFNFILGTKFYKAGMYTVGKAVGGTMGVWEIPYTVICGSLFSYYLMAFSAFLSHLKVRLLPFIGRKSLVIYLLHFNIINMWYSILDMPRTIGPQTVYQFEYNQLICFALSLVTVGLLASALDKKN